MALPSLLQAIAILKRLLQAMSRAEALGSWLFETRVKQRRDCTVVPWCHSIAVLRPLDYCLAKDWGDSVATRRIRDPACIVNRGTRFWIAWRADLLLFVRFQYWGSASSRLGK